MIALLSLTFSMSALGRTPAYIAIIIDDMGNNLPLGKRAIDLPGQATYSVLPYTPYARELANRAHRAGKEVMLHEPMTNIAGTSPGPGALTMSLNRTEFTRTFDNALASVPWVRGVNNHEGSLLTQQTRQMDWLMANIKAHGLYFIDSRTTPRTVALRVARQSQVTSAHRNVFLDDVLTSAAINRQFQELIGIAQREGTAIAIGHPHKLTLKYLKTAIPQLGRMNVQLVSVPALIQMHQLRHLLRLSEPGPQITHR